MRDVGLESGGKRFHGEIVAVGWGDLPVLTEGVVVVGLNFFGFGLGLVYSFCLLPATSLRCYSHRFSLLFPFQISALFITRDKLLIYI